MGGRGKKNSGAAGAVAPTVGPNGTTTDMNQVAKQLGFKNLEDLRKATDYQRAIDEQLHTAGANQDFIDALKNGKLTTEQIKSALRNNPKLANAVVIRHLARYTHGSGTLGPIMLRFGLPRDRLLDIVNVMKPLRDHALLSMDMPFTLPGWQDPFAAAAAASSGGVSAAEMPTILDWLSQMKVRTYVSDVWLKRVSRLSSNLFNSI